MFETINTEIQKLEIVKAALVDLKFQGLALAVDDIINSLVEILDEEDDEWMNQ